jgi:hypothetical protein
MGIDIQFVQILVDKRTHLRALFSGGSFNHPSGNDRPCKRGSEQIDAFIDAIGLNSWSDELGDKLSFEILNKPKAVAIQVR